MVVDLRPFWKYTVILFLMSFPKALVRGTCMTLCTSLDMRQEFNNSVLPKMNRSSNAGVHF